MADTGAAFVTARSANRVCLPGIRHGPTSESTSFARRGRNFFRHDACTTAPARGRKVTGIVASEESSCLSRGIDRANLQDSGLGRAPSTSIRSKPVCARSRARSVNDRDTRQTCLQRWLNSLIIHKVKRKATRLISKAQPACKSPTIK